MSSSRCGDSGPRTDSPHARLEAAGALLEGLALRKTYRLTGRRRAAHPVLAVDGVSLSIRPGETVGLVGESGCGKSTLARLLLALERPSTGEVRYEGQDVWKLRGEARLRFRRDVQVVFQDPFGSLNPRLTVGGAIREVLRVHDLATGRDTESRLAELLEMVGLDPGDARRYPHEFSGGQRQRIGIARALSTGPRLIVADEPVSALDVSVQAQILTLLQDLQDELGLAYLFISHDLAVVRQVSDRVVVMREGRLVEEATVEKLFVRPAHEYTRRLLAAVPRLVKEPPPGPA